MVSMRTVYIFVLISAVCMCTDLDSAMESDGSNKLDCHCCYRHCDMRNADANEGQAEWCWGLGLQKKAGGGQKGMNHRVQENRQGGRSGERSADTSKKPVKRSGGPGRDLQKQSGSSQGSVGHRVRENKEEERRNKRERKRGREKEERTKRREKREKEREGRSKERSTDMSMSGNSHNPHGPSAV
jgi:hypothetical protein